MPLNRRPHVLTYAGIVGNPDPTHSVVSNCRHLSSTSCPVLVVPVVLKAIFSNFQYLWFDLKSLIPGALDPGRCHWYQWKQMGRNSVPGLDGCAGYLVAKKVLPARIAVELFSIPSSRIDTTTPFPAKWKGQFFFARRFSCSLYHLCILLPRLVLHSYLRRFFHLHSETTVAWNIKL